jgi:hypothetical protein
MGETMKKIIIYLLVFLNTIGLFSQDFFVNGEKGVNFNNALTSYNSSIFEFSSIFSSNSMKLLLGETELLYTRYPILDIFSLAQLDNQHLRLLRNMIYARYGYRFNSQDLITYFSHFDWYNPRFDNVDNYLTDNDRSVIQLIQSFENRNENLPNIVWNNPIGIWQDGPIMAAGWSDRFVIHPNNRLEFYFSQMREMALILGLNGSYIIKGNVLIYSVSQIYIMMNDSEINSNAAFGYQWKNTTYNTLTLETPIVYKFPITNVVTREIFEGVTREVLIIGRNFFKMENNVNQKF